MTAGQRNCYEAIKAEAERYSLDDALFAVRELIRDARDNATHANMKRDDFLATDSHYDDAMYHIEQCRNWIRRAIQ